jgi:NAD(P)-dependent dehydrogenase (short-subunit alcohol dehydrogenase family)
MTGTKIDGAQALVTGGNRGFGRALVDAAKADPRDVARQAADAIETGGFEVLADDTARLVKSRRSDDVTALYAQLAAA